MGKKDGKRTNKKADIEKTKQYKVKETKGKTEKVDDKTKVQKKVKTKKKHKVLKRVILFIIIAIIVAALVVAGIVAGIFFSDKYKVSEEDFLINKANSTVLDADGNVIATLTGDENRKLITLDDMPSYLPKAFVAIEDERFYEHGGIDILRTGKATLTYLLNGGKSSFGGSTITQQLIKNMFNDDERGGLAGVERKIREMARAYNTEKVLSKSQILETYLNYIYMGGYYESPKTDIMGVEAGAEYYFSKPAKELSIAEAAFLAGINNTPNSYYPFNPEEDDNTEIIKKRTKTVLGKMKELRDKLEIEMTDEQYEAAVQEVENGLNFKKGSIAKTSSYSYLVAAAIDQATTQLSEQEGLTYSAAKTKLCGSGYTIYTTQRTEIQTRMEEEFVKDKYIKSGRKKDKNGELINNHTQAAMVIIDHTTGQVVGTMGGLGTDVNALGYNRATQGTKQPGSSFKPIGVVAPALDKGIITAGTVYDDSTTDFGGNYIPHNSGSNHGLISVRHAIEYSSNIVHVKIMDELGPQNSIDFMKKVGVTISQEHAAISLALGTADVSPLQMAAAYAMIANDGVYITPTFYTKVTDKEGKTVLEPKQEQTRVLSTENAFIMKSILTQPVIGAGGTSTVCRMSGRDVGAKTGSTNDYIDRWLCGFTTYYTAATWFGFDQSESPVFSTNNAANIWAAIMKDVHSDLPKTRFEKPSNVVTARICLDSGCVATDSCTRTETEYFVKGTVPGACEGHQKLKICKDTGKIANEYCPNTEEKTYLVKPQKENTTLWKTTAGDKYNVPTETCNVHTDTKIEMINVVGKKLADAKKALEDRGLKVKVEYVNNKDEKKNEIVQKQSVAEKTKVDKGATITLTVYKKVDSSSGNQNTTNTTNTTNTNTTNTTNTNTTNTTTENKVQ